MRILLCGYGTGSRSGEQARQYKTLRIDAGDASKGTKIAKHGVKAKSRHFTSLNIKGRTRKVGDSLDNDVEILLFDLSHAEIASLIGKLLELADELSAERHGTDHVRRGRDRIKLIKTVMKSLARNMEQNNHVEILAGLITACEGSREGWEIARELEEKIKGQRERGEDNPAAVFEKMISVYARALPHLKAARQILGSWWKDAPSRTVELTPGPRDIATMQ